jgi:hypothetical protein
MPSMHNIQDTLKVMFFEADTDPDASLSINELIRWVAHNESVIEVLKTYEPTEKIEVDRSIVTNMYKDIVEERKQAQ